jgi:hypothetical protein
MTSFFSRNIPVRAVLAIAAMTLLGSVVLGRENPNTATNVVLPDSATPRAVTSESAADLDLRQIQRSKNTETINDLFAPRTTAVLPATAASPEPPAPPPAPSAPSLPFTYLGKFIDGDKTEIFVARGDEHYSIARGRTIDGQYKVEKVSAAAVTFIYLPLGTRQTLPIPALK